MLIFFNNTWPWVFVINYKIPIANVIICFQLSGGMSYWNNLFFTGFIGNTFLIIFTENAKARSISYFNNSNYRFVVRTEWIFGLLLTVFASCLTLLRANTIPKSKYIMARIFHLLCILAKKFYGKHWRNLLLIELNSHHERFICPSMFL